MPSVNNYATWEENGEWARPVKEITIDFNESSSAAGAYTVTIPIPAGSILTDIKWSNDVLWGAGTSALLNIGDSTSSTKFIRSMNVKTTPAVGNGWSLLANGLQIFTGTGTLSGGTLTKTDANILTGSFVILTPTSESANSGVLTLGTITSGTSFVVTSSNASDANTFSYVIINNIPAMCSPWYPSGTTLTATVTTTGTPITQGISHLIVQYTTMNSNRLVVS